jgi:hypothetical protein
MPQPRTARRFVLLFLTGLLVIAAAATSADAQSYGELGKPFTGSGKLVINKTDRAFGVDPTNNDVYVGDEPKENEYRIQRFDSTGKLLNSITMKFKNSEYEGIEGIAVDPTLEGGRVYALAVYEREGTEGGKRLDPEDDAAGALLAFTPELKEAPNTTNEKGGKGESELKGVLASKVALNAQSETHGAPTTSALLEPEGIAVDPTTHDILILGVEEQCKTGGSEPCEEAWTAAVQRVSSSGAIGKRWVDAGECFETALQEEGSLTSCPVENEQVQDPGLPNSLIVTANGRILVDAPGSQIWEIPQSFESGLAPADAPRPVPVLADGVAELSNPLQELFRFPTALRPEGGGALAYIQEAGEPESGGLIYQTMEVAGIFEQHRNPGVLMLELSASGASELGWTGGQNKVEQETLPEGGCAISQFSTPLVAAGAKRLLVLDPNKPSKEPPLPTPQIDTFGAGGSHCPTVNASAPTATLVGAQVGTAANPAPVGQKITLSSTVTQGNALSVTWSFGDGATETVNQPQFRTTKVQHAYATTGTKTVNETISTDNLAEPTVERTAEIIVGSSSGGEKPGGGEEPGGGGGSGGGGGGTGGGGGGGSGGGGGTGTGTTTANPGGGVQGIQTTHGTPVATLAGTSLAVTAAGAFPVKVSCPAGETACTGTITLKTLSAVAAGGKKKAILTLASGSFSVTGGTTKTITLHLSAKARTLLAHSHVLRGGATLVAHDASGASHTTLVTVTLKAAKKKK